MDTDKSPKWSILGGRFSHCVRVLDTLKGLSIDPSTLKTSRSVDKRGVIKPDEALEFTLMTNPRDSIDATRSHIISAPLLLFHTSGTYRDVLKNDRRGSFFVYNQAVLRAINQDPRVSALQSV